MKIFRMVYKIIVANKMVKIIYETFKIFKMEQMSMPLFSTDHFPYFLTPKIS